VLSTQSVTRILTCFCEIPRSARDDSANGMKFSVNWLREFVDLPDKIDKLAELLTLAGVEIESIETRGAKIDKVIVAQIKESSRHPNADRLTVCTVDDGSGQTRQIVCGATNYKVGDKVPLALPGAILPNGLEIKKSKLRGVESEGMLCSGKELGFSEDAAGLLILSPDAKIGEEIADLFPSDTILDVEITPNRGDLLSHFGLAREISALTGAAAPSPRTGEPARGRADSIKISAPKECPFYSARKIDSVKVGPSPDWLRAKIEAVGIRSINNIVDISNFVMLELGQPTHAFDADKLKGGIVVRLARDGEKFLALDGKTYTLTSKDLVIADQERVIGIGGVMGGEETGVTESTKNVLLEAAYFQPSSVRRTARTLSLPSDASYRFERGVGPEMILPASSRAANLMREVASGTPAKEIATAGKLPSPPEDVSLRYERCDQLLGLTLKHKEVDEILERFGLSKKAKAEKTGSTWKIPSHRRDLQRDVDLIEEVIRAYGVDKVSGTDRSRFTAASEADKAHDLETDLRMTLVARGFDEARTSKLLPREAISLGESAIELKNPLSEDHVALRPSLIPGLLGVLGRNVRAGAERVAIFELGRVFANTANSKFTPTKPSPSARRPPLPPSPSGRRIKDEGKGVGLGEDKGEGKTLTSSIKEERHLGILVWGNAASAHDWRTQTKRRLDFFDLKGALDSVGLPRTSLRRTQHVDLAMAAEILSGDRVVGLVGQLSASRASTIDAPGAVFIAEVDVDHVLDARRSAKTFRELERFPSVTRDIAMIVPEKISHAEILRAIENPKEALLESVQLFDLFTGELGEARKSLAYTLTYRDRSRTLTNEEVTAAHANIRERLRRDLGAELRE
jgi:phenylalanyl-tRNA synthetase beta chain